jgi:hypothetical protein
MHLKKFSSFVNEELSDGILYHLNHSLPLMESVYRIESDAWIKLVNESRSLWKSGEIELSEDDIFLISTDAGQTDLYEGSEVLLDVPFVLSEAEYQGKDVDLNKPFRTPQAPRKFAVYTKNDQGKVVIVRFGQPGMKIKNYDKEASKSFRARHGCSDPGPRWKPRWWSCNVHRYHKLLGLKSSNPW